jgi:ribosomal peptide maturation radical SAM protein 1
MNQPGAQVHLVSMPWHGIGMAPLALALVRGTLARSHPQLAVTEHFANILWAEYLLAESGGSVLPQHYHEVAETGLPLGLGDWIFAGVLYRDPTWRLSELTGFAGRYGYDISSAVRMRALAEGFCQAMADEIVAAEPQIVGFTTTFMQNVPSLALARLIKERSPSTIVVFGGANCDGAMGAALHRNHRFVDYVVRGDAELVVPRLFDAIMAGDAPDGIDGVCWWRDGTSVANPQLHPAVPAAAMAEVNYDAWHERFTTSPVRDYVLPWLVVEGSRGCWWGEKHHCTFCGLNDATLGFRGKPADRFWAEVSQLVERHRILDVITSDNIMSVDYFRELLPRIAGADWDLRVHFEMKANITEEQIQSLAAAGIVMVQFGIENFSTRVLRLMDKGIDGATAVRVLRDSANHGVSVAWNYLYGFPGEDAADYRAVIAQLPALVHLQPPTEGCMRISLQRFSPYFERPELGFAARTPASFYAHVYDLPEQEVRDIAYYFDCPDRGISGDTENDLHRALGWWRRHFQESSLHIAQDDDRVLVIEDRRAGWPPRTIELTGWRRDAYRGLRKPSRAEKLRQRLNEAADTDSWLAGMREQGLVFCDDGRWVALATDQVHAKLSASLPRMSRGPGPGSRVHRMAAGPSGPGRHRAVGR